MNDTAGSAASFADQSHSDEGLLQGGRMKE
jgi:hypothetical protein